SSVNHMGYFLLGLAAGTPAALNGALFVMISHGLISALFFFCVGMFYERTHTREFAKLGGMFLTVPVIATVTAVTAFANLGLPGMSGFIGEFFVFLGAYPVFKYLVVIAGAGLVVTAAMHLIMMRKVLQGNPMEEWKGLPDITGREWFIAVPLIALIVYLGIYPAPLINVFNPAVVALSKMIGGI
ncbi:MAG: NADH-quinone oxidoreductase subunit M, partial [Actinobacteria bacterium]|nr:NADH-quinone oxidoreductase subunit M [Actinomycetota bacterium]